MSKHNISVVIMNLAQVNNRFNLNMANNALLLFLVLGVDFALANGSLNQVSQATSGYLSQSLDKQLSTDSAVDPVTPSAPLEKNQGGTPGGTSFFLEKIVFSGSKVIPFEELEEQSSAYLNKSVTLADIEKLGNFITQYALSKGHIIQVFAPPQEVRAGVLRLQISQAILGGVGFTYDDGGSTPLQDDPARRRLLEEKAADYIYVGNKLGAPLDLKALDKSIIIFNEQFNKNYSGVLKPGMLPGQTDLILNVTPKDSIFGFVSANTYGPQSTGIIQYSAQAVATDVFGIGESFSLSGLTSEGTNFIKVGYSMPVLSNGLRLSLDVNSLQYRTVGINSGSKGGSASEGIQLSYPLFASNAGITNLTAGVANRSFDNSSLNSIISLYNIRSIFLSVGGYTRGNIIANSVDSYNLNLSSGSIYNNKSPEFYQSNYIASTNSYVSYVPNNYTKLNASFSKKLFISDLSTLKIAASGQVSSANLNSGEALYVSGPGAVRAYRPAVAYGTQGGLFSIDYDRTIGAGFSTGIFFDYATVAQYKSGVTNAMINSSTPPNQYAIYGGGIKAGYIHNKEASVSAYLAMPLDRTTIPSLQSTGGKPSYIVGVEAVYTGSR